MEPSAVPFVLGALLLTVIVATGWFLRFAYWVEGDTLIVEGGLVGRWRRVIPLPRIQSVDFVEKLRHRVFGVVELRIEAAGGRQTEAALVAVTPGEAENLRARLLARGGAPPAPHVETPVLASLGPGLLALAGITGGRVAVIAVILGYAQDLASDRFLVSLFERLGRAGSSGVLLLLAAIAAFLVLSLAVSIVATIVVYWDFTLRRERDRLVVSRGLLEKRRAAVPLSRLQAIVLEQNLVRLAFGLASLRAITAGFSGRSEEEKETSVLLPIADQERALAVVAELFGDPAARLFSRLERPPVRALVRRLIWWSAPAVAIGLATSLVWGPLGALVFVLVPIAWLLAVASWVALGHVIDDGLGVARSGVLVRRTTFTPLRNLQHLSLAALPDQRLLDLGSLRLEVPGASTPLRDLARARAEERFALLSESMAGRASHSDGGSGRWGGRGK
ncbi:MAG TPA: PH domain-containing protein [Actinomycetota bacterium]|nr:PH domain-containing protein [Actinomycetota bacterium]